MLGLRVVVVALLLMPNLNVLLPSVLAAPTSDPTQSTRLIGGEAGVWQFDADDRDTTNGVTRDTSGNGYHATLGDGTVGDAKEPSFQPTGGVGGSGYYSFGNHEDYLRVENQPAFNPSQITILARVSIDPTPGLHWTFEDIVAKAAGADGYYTAIHTDGAGAHRLAVYVYGIGSSSWLFSDVTLITNDWVSLAWSYDGSKIVLYVDGQVAGQRTGLSGSILPNSNPLYVSASVVDGRYFYGAMDEVRIYGRALAQSEIQSVSSQPYEGGSPVAGCTSLTAESSTRALWKFSSSNPGLDSSGNGNDLSFVGSPSFSGDAFNLDGADDRGLGGDSPTLSSRDALTVEACIYAERLNGGIAGQSGGPGGFWTGSWYFLLTSTGALRFWVSGDGAADSGVETAGGVIQERRTYQLKATYSGAARSVEIYVDGVKQNADPKWGPIPSQLFDSTQPIDVGVTRNSNDVLGPYFQGTIDEVRISGTGGGGGSPSSCNSLSADSQTRALWKFSGSDPGADSSGNGNGITLYNGAASVNDALQLDGVDDYASRLDSPSLSIRDALTVEACIRPDRLNGGIAGQSGGPEGWAGAWYFLLLDTGALRFWVSGNGGTDSGVETNAGVIATGSVYRLRAHYDGSVPKVEIFVNDSPQTVTPKWSAIPGQLFDSDQPIDVGATRNSGNSLGPYFQGMIDEVRISGPPMTPSTDAPPDVQPGTPSRLRVAGQSSGSVTIHWDPLGSPASPEVPTVQRSSLNPVISVGAWEGWEGLYAYLPRLVTDWDGVPKLDPSGRYQMIYTGGQCQPYPNCGTGSIDQGGLAYSTDGKTWTKHPQNPVLKVRPSEFDESDAAPVTVVWDAEMGKYRVWYEGSRLDTPLQDDNIRIGYAESSDLITWTNRKQVLGPSAGCYDWDDVLAPVVFKDPTAPASERYKLWYMGHGSDAYILFYATSPDGIAWTKRTCATGIFYDSRSVNPTQIFRDENGVWWLYYFNWRPMELRMARSADGINWEAINGVLITPDTTKAWEADMVYWHRFTKFGNEWRVFYTGRDADAPSKGRIGFGYVGYTRLDHYEIERRPVGGVFAQVGTSTRASFVDSTIASDQSYEYRVRVVDTLARTGAWSPVFPFTGSGGGGGSCPALIAGTSTRALWRFDDANAVSAPDSSGNGNTLFLLGGANPQAGALALDGVDDYGSAEDRPSFSLTEAITIEACVRPESTTGSVQPATGGVVAQSGGPLPGGDNWVGSWYLMLNQGKIRFWLSSDGRTDMGVETTSAVISTGTTYRIRAVYVGATQSAEIFVNDNKVDASPPTWSTGIPTRLHDSTQPVDVGTVRNSVNSLGPFFRGTIDEVRITSGPPTGNTNARPNPPSPPNGPLSTVPGQSNSYTTSATDPDGDTVAYTFLWGDGASSSTGFVGSGTPASASHTWSAAGTFCAQAYATDSKGAQGDASSCAWVTVTGGNLPPDTPDPPAGPSYGPAGKAFAFTAWTRDPNGDTISYTFLWGDGTSTTISGAPSGNSRTASHAWSSPGVYCVRVYATDAPGNPSAPSLCSWITIRVGDYDLAQHYAPVFYHDVDESDASADEIVLFHFDGDFRGDNNWENEPASRHEAWVYYYVMETETHYFIGYMVFHPRDWWDGSVPDPTLTEDGGEHENDMEGALVVVRKTSSTLGEFAGVLTMAHNWFNAYYDDSTSVRPEAWTNADIRNREGAVTFWTPDGGKHAELGIQSRGHGIFGRFDTAVWDNQLGDFRGGSGNIYWPLGFAEQPGDNGQQRGNDRDVSYALTPIDELWQRRHNYGAGQDAYASYGAFRGDTLGGCGTETFESCSENSAHAPWAMDAFDGGSYIGELFEDPANVVDVYLTGLGSYSRTYLYRSTGGVAESFHPYENDRSLQWTWKWTGASSVRAHFETIAVEPSRDFVEILDAAGRVVETFTGIHSDAYSPWVAGDTLSIRIRSDGTGQGQPGTSSYWGFYADQLEAG